MRRVQDLNLWTLLRIGALAMPWFKPLTQLSIVGMARFELASFLASNASWVTTPKHPEIFNMRSTTVTIRLFYVSDSHVPLHEAK